MHYTVSEATKKKCLGAIAAAPHLKLKICFYRVSGLTYGKFVSATKKTKFFELFSQSFEKEEILTSFSQNYELITRNFMLALPISNLCE